MCLSFLHAGVPHAFELCGAVFLSAAACAAFVLALCLVVSGHFSTQTCAHRPTTPHVWWSLPALSFEPQARLALFPWLPLTTIYCGLDLLEVSCVIGSSSFFPLPVVRVPCLDVVVEAELLFGHFSVHAIRFRLWLTTHQHVLETLAAS